MKRLLSILLAVLLLLGQLPVCAFASEPATEGTCGEELVWKLDEAGTLTISGTGMMDIYDYWSRLAPWSDVRERILRLVVEEGVTFISPYAFYACSQLTEVSLPDTLTSISNGAFDSCTSLKRVVIPDSVTDLGAEAFASCSGLESVTFGSGVKALGSHTFYFCTSLKEITIPDTIHSIGYLCFYGCSGLETVNIGNGVRRIEENAFRSCSALKEITIPGSVMELENNAFADCTALASVTIENGVTELQHHAFTGCTALEEIILPPSLDYLGGYVFENCTALTSVILSEGLETIYGCPFTGCSGLETVVIPASVRTVATDFFAMPEAVKAVHFLGDAPAQERITEGALREELQICIGSDAKGWDDPAWEGYPLVVCEYTAEGDPDCMAGGIRQVKCSHCDLDYAMSVSGNHTYGPWYTALEPTETEAGRWERKCSFCGAAETMEIPASPQTPAQTHNEGDQDYSIWTATVKSHLLSHDDGTFSRIEATEDGVSVEVYDEDFTFVSRRMLPMELPLFGGFYAGEDYYFLVFGQENPEEDDYKEVIRIVCYSKEWVRLGHAWLPGKGITIPFDAGTLRMVQKENRLVLLMGREMYSIDGLNHQSNLLFSAPIDEMTEVGNQAHILPAHDVLDMYVSHSFNQFLLVRDGKVVTLNHGDGNPRSAVIHIDPPNRSTFRGHHVLRFAGYDGQNTTGASLGAFLLSDSALLTAGNSIRQDGTVSTGGQRNIFLGVTRGQTETELETQLKWFTDYPDDAGVHVSTPHLVRIDGDRFLLMWTEERETENVLCYVFTDGNGEETSPVYEREHILLSDCVPVVANGKVCWYVTMSSDPLFFTISLTDPEDLTIYSPEVRFVLYPNGGTLEQEVHIGYYGSPVGTLPVPERKEAYLFTGWYASHYLLPDEHLTEDLVITWLEEMTVAAHWELQEHEHEYEAVSVTPGDCQTPECTRMECRLCDTGYNSYSGSPAHAWDEGTVIREPSCTERGETEYRCTLCGETKTESIPATGHSYTAVITEPTCTEYGYTTHTCHCGDSYISDYKPYTGHSYGTWTVTTEPDCTESGEERRTCANCGEYESRTIPAAGHSYTAVVTEPTCTEGGYTTYTCGCGESHQDDYTEALGHSWNDGEITRAPTEDREGERTFTCLRCEATKTESVPKLEHTHSYTAVVTEPTCTEGGYTTYTCDCGESYQDDYTEATGHSYETEVIAPTCTEPGYTRHTCAVCGHSYTSAPTAATGHVWDEGRVTREPTEEETGERTFTCTLCGETKTEPIDPVVHVHSYETVVTEPTCTEAGHTTYTCDCGHSYVEEQAALGHDWSEWEEIREGTCLEPGAERRSCLRCGEEELIEETTGCQYFGVTHRATCTEPGYTRYTCRICGSSYVETDSEPLGHDYETTVVEPTCTEGGYTLHTCSRCEDAYTTDESEALGHAYEDGLCVRCGEPEDMPVRHNPFIDVAEGAWYYESVLWAVEEGITSGTTPTTFSPDSPCTRAQVVTFLWRAMGQPEPRLMVNPFSDVKEGDYYYSAVLWAVEQGVTAGTSQTTFSPDAPCTRAQVVTFLWRAMGQPEPEAEDHPFDDVPEGAWFAETVLWAVENGITAGVSDTAFAPDDPCTRAQVVTFLYRTLSE